MITRLMILATGFLAACGSQPASGPSTRASNGGADTCNAAAYAGMVGQDAVVALSIPEPKRQYRLSDPVTLDFNPARVNIELDETDVITAIKCG